MKDVELYEFGKKVFGAITTRERAADYPTDVNIFCEQNRELLHRLHEQQIVYQAEWRRRELEYKIKQTLKDYTKEELQEYINGL